MSDLRNLLKISDDRLAEINALLTDPGNELINELVEIAKIVPNISAKHEGGEVEIEQDLDHPSDILDYFMAKSDVESQGLMPALEQNYIEKHRSTNLTADALTKAGIAVVCATELHNAA